MTSTEKNSLKWSKLVYDSMHLISGITDTQTIDIYLEHIPEHASGIFNSET